MTTRTRIVPAVLCGGHGTRLWPVSRVDRPKPFQSLDGGPTGLQITLRRARALAPDAPLTLLGAVDHRFLLAEQVREEGLRDVTILLEPVARGTAAAVALAAIHHLDHGRPDDVLVLLPADHHVTDEASFVRAARQAAGAVSDGGLAVLGVPATEPSTAYGWIEAGHARLDGARSVLRFHEKPDAATAAAYLDAGLSWNAGVFIGRADALRDALARQAPEILDAAQDALSEARQDLDFIRLSDALARAPDLPFDRAVLERTDDAVVVALDAGWSDVGSWDAVHALLPQDADGNARRGPTLLQDSTGTLAFSDGHVVIAGVGLHDLMVAATADAVLVAPRDRVQQVRDLVGHLRDAGHDAADRSATVHRPWGHWTRLLSGDGFAVKAIVVHPGARLSLQRHAHRAETWVVVAGTAEVTLDDEVRRLSVHEVLHVPVGATHRLANPGPEPLRVIELSTGAVLSEDDIERLDDDYARDAMPSSPRS